MKNGLDTVKVFDDVVRTWVEVYFAVTAAFICKQLCLFLLYRVVCLYFASLLLLLFIARGGTSLVLTVICYGAYYLTLKVS